MKKKLFISLILFLLPITVFADTGPKPSINITLKNMNTTNYKIDLLSDFSDNKDDIDEIVEYYSQYKDEPIYKYHEGTMYATTLRNFLLHGSIEGNKDKSHTFTYFGVPNEFKVIIQMPDGSIRVSELLKKKAFDYDVVIDVNDMKVVSENKDINKIIFNFIIVLLITVIIEFVIALFFKTKKYYIIIATNIITNTLLQCAMFKSEGLTVFLVLEAIIIVSEYFIYLRYIDINKKKLLIYTLVANLITMLITFIV